MLGRTLIVCAIVVYVAVMLGCVLSEPSVSPALAASRVNSAELANPTTLRYGTREIKLPLRGVGMQLQRIDWIEQYKRSIDEIADVGADTVLLVVDARMENGRSSVIYLDMRLTPNPDQLTELIRHAKARNLRVVLMPIVLLDKPKGMEWRGTITPESWYDWWESYRALLHHLSWIAEAAKADVMVVGSELVSTEKMADEWRKTIAQVRKEFHGLLTYSANWDHYKDIPFWNQLDLVAMNSYWALGRDQNVKLEEIQARWAEIQSNVLGFARKMNKPLVFTEVGWCSIANAAHEPWDYTRDDEPINTELQRRLYEGFFRSWHGKKDFGGFIIWEWTPGDGGPDNRGYTPENKPAEKVLREWLAKPW